MNSEMMSGGEHKENKTMSTNNIQGMEEMIEDCLDNDAHSSRIPSHINFADIQLIAISLAPLFASEIQKAEVQILTDAMDAVRKCASPDRKEEKNKIFEAMLIKRIDAMDAIDDIRRITNQSGE